MNAIILRCRPGAAFRLGETSLDDTSDILHSDTLFSGLVNAYAMAYGDANVFVRWFQDGMLSCSSGFHCFQLDGGKEIFFLPRPGLRFGSGPEDKRIRRVRFVSVALWNRIRSSLTFTPEEAVTSVPLQEMTIFGGSYALLKHELSSAWELASNPAAVTSAPKVSVHKSTVRDSYYHEANLRLEEVQNAEGERLRLHFYILYRSSLAPDEHARFAAAVRILADEGIGGSRSTGGGHVDRVEFTTLDIVENPGDAGVSLSLVSPRNDEELRSLVAYDVVLRGGGSLGKEGGPEYHRKRVRLVCEGAIVRGAVTGQLVDVSPGRNSRGHQLWCNGKAFVIPIEV